MAWSAPPPTDRSYSTPRTQSEATTGMRSGQLKEKVLPAPPGGLHPILPPTAPSVSPRFTLRQYYVWIWIFPDSVARVLI